MTTFEKEFVLSHVFKGVSSIGERYSLSPIKVHFNLQWQIVIRRKANHFEVCLSCLRAKTDKEWVMEIWTEVKITAVDGKTHFINGNLNFKNTDKSNGKGWKCFKWNDLMKDYVINDSLKMEMRVTMKKATGIALRNFTESAKDFSDVVLVVENQKFYVSKLFLARQSSSFKSLLPSESEEHTLENVKAADFQKFLELLHGDDPIDEFTVVGITNLADIYGAKIAIEKCEQFLVETSKKPLKEKLHLAHLYKLEKLKNHCLSKISTVSEIRLVLSDDLSEMDPVVSGALLQKFMANYEKSLKSSFKLTVIPMVVLSVVVLCILVFLVIHIVIG